MIINHVAEITKTKKKTVRELSQEAGLRYNTVLALIRGQSSRVDLHTIDAICRALGVQPGDLFTYVESPEEEQQ